MPCNMNAITISHSHTRQFFLQFKFSSKEIVEPCSCSGLFPSWSWLGWRRFVSNNFFLFLLCLVNSPNAHNRQNKNRMYNFIITWLKCLLQLDKVKFIFRLYWVYRSTQLMPVRATNDLIKLKMLLITNKGHFINFEL